MAKINNNEEDVVPQQTITMTVDQLNALVDERIKNRGIVEKPKRVTDRTARMRIHNGQAVVGFGQVKERMDASIGRPMAWLEITLEDGKVETVPYLEFLNSPNSVLVQIKRTQVEEIVKSDGYIHAQNPNPKDIKNWKDAEVEAVSTSEKRTMEVLILEGELKGKELTVDGNVLNS